MKTFEIWDHWSMLGEVDAYNSDHAIRVYKKAFGGDWIKMFAKDKR